MLVTHGPRLPTCALQQVGSYLSYTDRDVNVAAKAAHDPKRTSVCNQRPCLFSKLCPAVLSSR
jgi:hypothetical protein